MPERSRRRPRDVNKLAAEIVDEATSDKSPATKPSAKKREKNPAAVALGRLGGLKGGKARAEKLSPEERSEMARHAARKRWQGT